MCFLPHTPQGIPSKAPPTLMACQDGRIGTRSAGLCYDPRQHHDRGMREKQARYEVEKGENLMRHLAAVEVLKNGILEEVTSEEAKCKVQSRIRSGFYLMVFNLISNTRSRRRGGKRNHLAEEEEKEPSRRRGGERNHLAEAHDDTMSFSSSSRPRDTRSIHLTHTTHRQARHTPEARTMSSSSSSRLYRA